MLHLSRDCPWVHDIWRAADISFLRSLLGLLGMSWIGFGFLLVKKVLNVLLSFVGMCGKLEMRWSLTGFSVPPVLCVGRAVDWLVEYHNALSLDRSPGCNDRAMVQWVKPPHDVVKVNFDGVFPSKGRGMALVLWLEIMIAKPC